MTKIDAPAPSFAAPPEHPGKALERAGKQFEALLFREMVKAMVGSSTEGGFFGQEAGADTWEQMFESGMSDFLAEHTNMGIARQISERYAPSEEIRGQEP